MSRCTISSKTKLLSISAGLVMLLLPVRMFATTHIVNFGGSLGLVFSPDSFAAHVGDTVTWNGDFTMHSTTSESIPTGAASWNHGVGGTGAGTTFSYKITVAGTYKYQCNVHVSDGMVGKFIVTSTAVLPARARPLGANAITVTAIPLSGKFSLRLTLPQAEIVSFRIFNSAGRQVLSQSSRRLRAGVNAIPLSALPAGAYHLKLIANGTTVTKTFSLGR